MSNSILTYQVLLDIQRMLKAQSDPKFLEKALEDSYSLGAAGEKKVADAKATIAANNSLLAEIKANQDRLKIASDDLEQKKQDFETVRTAKEKEYQDKLDKLAADRVVHEDNITKLKNQTDSLIVYKATLDDQAAQNKKDAQDLAAERETFSGKVAAHTIAAKALDDKTTELEAYEASLKASAANIKKEAERL